MDKITKLINTLGSNAQTAAKQLRNTSTKVKNDALANIAKHIIKQQKNILNANKKDVENSKNKGLNQAMLERLILDKYKINNIILSLESIIALPDLTGEITDLRYQKSGIQVGKMRTPLGVICIIYESRPNVTIDAAALCLKSANSVILRGGSEAINSNIALYECIQLGLSDVDINKNCVQFVKNTDRKIIHKLVKADTYIDAIIPRGSKNLIKAIADKAKVTIIKHLDGVCHTYVDKYADKQKAIDIAFNGKTRHYGLCNTTETLLVHKNIANDIMPDLLKKYIDKGVELRGCARTQKFANVITKATDDDWYTEYLAPILSIRIVDSLNQAIEHIEKYGSKHTDAIVSENLSRGRKFLNLVDSSSVIINASTSFADGFEYGLGAEIGISTDKFHVRGPVGLEGLSSQKFIVIGDGHIRK